MIIVLLEKKKASSDSHFNKPFIQHIKHIFIYFSSLQGPAGPQGPIGYPGPRGVKVRFQFMRTFVDQLHLCLTG